MNRDRQMRRIVPDWRIGIRQPRKHRRLVLAVIIMGMAADAPAVDSFIEAGANYHTLSGNFGDWKGLYFKSEWQQDERNRWHGEILRQREFDASGTYAAGGVTHVFSPDWHSSLTVGSGTSVFFLPRLRVDAFLHRKWLEARNLILTVGAGYYDAHDVHRDRSAFLGATYYFESPWIVEGGVRWNWSDPGAISSSRAFVAVTRGTDKVRYVTLRYENGHEAYQLIGTDTALVDFRSDVVSLTWREWVRSRAGFNLVLEHYDNPFYRRQGAVFGVFKEF